MPDKPTKIGKTETFTTSRSHLKALGCMDVTTPRGDVHAHDAQGYMTLLIDRPGLDSSIGMLSYQMADEGNGFGYIVQMDAPSAREIAASLIRLANAIDHGGH